MILQFRGATSAESPHSRLGGSSSYAMIMTITASNIFVCAHRVAKHEIVTDWCGSEAEEEEMGESEQRPRQVGIELSSANSTRILTEGCLPPETSLSASEQQKR